MFKTLTAITATLIFAGSAAADLVNPDIPTWRGDANTTYAQWDSFTNASGGPNNPDSGFGYNLFNFGQGAIIASSGNLYGPSDASLNIHVYPAGAPLYNMQEAVVNVAYQGNPLDIDNFQAYVGEVGSGTYVSGTAELRNELPGGFGGATWAITFDLSNVAFGFQNLSFFFGSELANTSLDAISIDVLGSQIPAPGALMAIGLLGVVRRRRG